MLRKKISLSQNKTYYAFITGVLSGLLSSLIVIISIWSDFGQFIIYVLPGLIFGASIVYYYSYYRNVQKSFISFFLFMAASTVGYFSAAWIYENIDMFFPYTELWRLPLAGIAGSIILLIGFRLFILPISLKHFIVLTLLGGLLALTFMVPLALHQPLSRESEAFYIDIGGAFAMLFSVIVLLICWQTVMAGALGIATKKIKSASKK